MTHPIAPTWKVRGKSSPLPLAFLHSSPPCHHSRLDTLTRRNWGRTKFCNAVSAELDSSTSTSTSSPASSSSSASSRSYSVRAVKVDEREQNWVLDNAGAVRSAPLHLGAAGVAVVLLNRFTSGIAAVADATSAQPRADVLVIALSAAVVLTGLVWKSIEPKPQTPVNVDGIQCMSVMSGLAPEIEQEITWVWEALAGATSAVAVVVVYGKKCVLQAGLAAEGSAPGVPRPVDTAELLQGSLCSSVQKFKKQMYLANLALYPSRYELPFLPSKTQSVIVQPLSDEGVMIIGGDTLRGFDRGEQGWIIAIAEKLDSTLADLNVNVPSL